MLSPPGVTKIPKKQTTNASLATLESIPPPSPDPSQTPARIQVIDLPESPPTPALPKIIGVDPPTTKVCVFCV